jgi:transaldolase / glucose-6-phosphate isomerase
VQPFDQPDVEAAKVAAREALAGEGPRIDPVPATDLLGALRPGDHLALQGFVDPGGPDVERLEQVRRALRDRYRVATSVGIGPRYLHSTGQLHKGGPPGIVCAQVLDRPDADVDIPGRDVGFGHLLAAQADGDLVALRQRGIRAGRVTLDDLEEAAT